MLPDPKGRSIIAAHYFIYFGVMGLYLPFFNLYCYHIGFDGWQIGTISATRSIVLILFSISWSLLADRYQARRTIYQLCNVASALMWGIFLITSDYFWILAATVLYGIFYAPQIAFLEAFTMDWLGGERKRYGAMRAWGSLSFICVVLAMGRIIEQRGVGIILVLILAGSWLQAVAAFGLPRTVAHRRGLSGKFWRQLLKPRLAVFWCCAFFMLFSHGAYYAFFSIHLSQLGFGSGFIGLCWALASCAEVVIMLNSRRLFKRFSYETVMMVAFVAAVIRWGGMGVARSAWSLILLQLTHTLTYGAFHMASILYTDHWAPDEDKTLAQSVNNAVTYGLGLMAGFFLSGALYERIGANAMFAVSALIALVGAVAFGIFILVMRRLAPYSIMGSR